MKKPIIGIPAKQPDLIKGDLWHRWEVVDEIRLLVTKFGGVTIMLLPSERTLDFNKTDAGDTVVLTDEEKQDLHRQVDLCDGMIMQGGLYSCEFEVEIARYALEEDLPMIGICAGFNNILRALGSNVYEDLTGSHNHYVMKYRHPVDIVEGTMIHELIRESRYEVNSMHTMMADEDMVAPYATIGARDPEGHVESFEVPEKKFVLAMKWHPELMSDEEYVTRLFERYIAACRKGE